MASIIVHDITDVLQILSVETVKNIFQLTRNTLGGGYSLISKCSEQVNIL